MIFAGFILSSVFKAIFTWFPVDMTAFFMGWSALVAIKRLFANPTIEKRAINPIIIFTVLALIIIASLLYTPGTEYATSKSLLFVTLTAWSFFGVFILIRDLDSLSLFIKGILFYSVISVGYTVFDYFNSGLTTGYGRFGINDSNILGLARISGFGAIILLVLYLYNNIKIKKKIIPLILFIISVTALMITGSRMPLASFLFSIIVLFVLSFKFKRFNFNIDIKISKKLLSLIISVPVILILVMPFINSGIFYTSITRFLRMFSTEGSIDAARSNLYSFGFSLWEDSPIFGKGIGSFPIYFWGVDRRDYPHNIFIEALSELGFIGFAIIFILIVISIIHIFKGYVEGLNNYQLAVVLGFIYFLLNANTTGDFNDNRILFTFIALCCMLPVYHGPKSEINITKKSIQDCS